MTESLPRVVLDTVVFLQSLISDRGHAAGCLQRLRAGQFILLMSDDLFLELKDVPFRPKLRTKYPFITDEKVAVFIAEIERLAVRIAKPPTALLLPRDPKDEPLIDLAVAGDARFVVSWNDRHLNYLMRQDTPEGREFCARFPNIKIVTPPEFLKSMDQR
jgi:putative PIN family toxin of toxin-antitoxin system